jgi:type IV pilus assembly protein PilE
MVALHTVRGMSLLELLTVMALAGLLLSAGLGLWREQMIRIRLGEARVALAQNARFLESWYLKHGRYCKQSDNGCVWPALAVPKTQGYRIRFGSVSEHRTGRYRLWAEPDETAWQGQIRLLMDQDGQIVECRRIGSDKKSDFCAETVDP